MRGRGGRTTSSPKRFSDDFGALGSAADVGGAVPEQPRKDGTLAERAAMSEDATNLLHEKYRRELIRTGGRWGKEANGSLLQKRVDRNCVGALSS
jgi:hypothetical protein